MPYVDFSHGGNIYEIRREYGKEIIDFSANINPLVLPPAVKRAVHKNFDKILHYPDSHAAGLVQKIAEYWGISKKNLLLGNGSAELIYLITASLRPKRVLIPIPTFSEYERASRNVNSEIRFLRLQKGEDFKWNLPVPGNADIIFLCHPNNPTGDFILNDPKEIGQLGNSFIVVDEAFMDFVPDQRDHTLIWKAAKSQNLIVLRTFTKLFAMPGLRIGYMVAHKDIINKLRQHQPPWSINSLAQVAAEAILNESGYVCRTHRLIEKERGFLFSELEKIEGLKPYPSKVNFLLIRIDKQGMTSSLLTKGLIRKGILIRDCSNFRNLDNKFIRIAVRSHKENLKLIEALRGEI